MKTAELRNSPTRHRREGFVLRQHGGNRILAEAEEAPDQVTRLARWKYRYACVDLEQKIRAR